MSDTKNEEIRIGQISHQWATTQKITAKYYSNTDSTNKKAKDEAFTENAFAEHLIVYFADQQTAGKGRGQNTWITPKSGTQLLSTWSFLIEEPTLPIISPMIGLALYRAAVSTWPFLNWNLKAPNDLFIEDKKVAGLLLETISQGQDLRLLIGLGLNVIQHPAELAHATSLAAALGPQTPLLAQDWISFLERIIFEFSIAIQLSFEELNSTSSAALLTALNKHPLLKEKYTAIDGAANLQTQSKKISWQEL